MSKGRIGIALFCCLPMLATAAHSQSKLKPGLWEVTSQMSMGGQGAPQMPAAAQNQQMPQLPPGVKLPPGVQMPSGGAMGSSGSPFGPHTSQICVTQAMIDKYGGPYQNPPRGDCQVTNVSMKIDSMSADISCTGQMTAKGTVSSTWSDDQTTHTTVHLSGTMQMGPNSRPMDVTMESSSVYKGPDCGSVKPITMPAGN
jgi:hypothetical protein